MEVLLFCFLGLAVILVILGIKILKENERLGVFRFGKFHRILGPGLVFLIPLVETSEKIDLLQSIPNWKSLSNRDLNENLLAILNIRGEVGLDAADSKSLFLDFLGKVKVFMNPEFDLGIENIRLRGIIRIIIGLIFPVILAVITVGGFWLYDAMGVGRSLDPEDIDVYLFCLVALPSLLSVMTSIHVIWGIGELVSNRTWNQISRSIRWIMLITMGIPIYGIICYLTTLLF